MASEHRTDEAVGVHRDHLGRLVVNKPSAHLYLPRKLPSRDDASGTRETDGHSSDDNVTPRSSRKVVGCSPRIAGPQVKPHEPLPPLQPAKKLTAAAERALIGRVCDDAVRQHEQRFQSILQKYIGQQSPRPTSAKTSDELAEGAFRLSTQEVQNRAARHKALELKYLTRSRPASSRPREPPASDSPKVLVQRLYDDSIKHQQQVACKLAGLYTPERQVKKLTKDEMTKLTTHLACPKK